MIELNKTYNDYDFQLELLADRISEKTMLLNRQYIGFDLSSEYCKIAENKSKIMNKAYVTND